MPGRLLVAYSNGSNFVSTTAEYLAGIGRYTGFDVRYLHVTHNAEPACDLNEFDAIFHNYCARLPFDGYVSPAYIEKLKSFRGVKLVAVQDEYENTNKLKTAIQAIGFDVVFTNAAGETIEAIYPRREFPDTEFITVLTGYVPEDLEGRGHAALPLRDRPIHIGYRCRVLPAYYGRLGHDKFEIGRRMREICEARGIPHDIEWSDDKRLYGDAWYQFIGRCRTNLGAESGSNAFDFDGSLKATYETLSEARGGPAPYEEFYRHTDPVEARFDFGQISPRVFEAAALRTPLILFSGKYSDAIRPDEHFIELKKDFSNVDQVLARLDDIEGLQAMAERTYRRLVASGDFSYRSFCRLVADTVERKAAERKVPLRGPHASLVTDDGYDPTAAVSLLEHPSSAPRHPAVFFHRKITGIAELQLAEIARLNKAVNELQTSNAALLSDVTRLLQPSKLEAALSRHAFIKKILPAKLSMRLKWGLALLARRL